MNDLAERDHFLDKYQSPEARQQAEAEAEENIYRRLMYNMDGCDEIYEQMADNIKPLTQTIAAHRKDPAEIGRQLLSILEDAIADTGD